MLYGLERAGLGRRTAGGVRRRPCAPAVDLASSGVVGEADAARRGACRSPGSRATSRRRCSGRDDRAGPAKITYGTGSFVLSTPAGARAARRGLLTTRPAAGRPRPTRSRGGVRRRRGDPVAARRARLIATRLRRGAGEVGRLDRRRVLRAGAHGPRLAVLGPGRARPIVGLTRGTTRAHLVRAALEAIAFQVADVLDAAALPVPALRADGGAAATGWLMQFQADLLGVPWRWRPSAR